MDYDTIIGIIRFIGVINISIQKSVSERCG